MEFDEERVENERGLDLRPGLIASGISVFVMLSLSVSAWVQIPAGRLLPVHWGFSGTPDRYGSKWEALLTIPVIAIFAVLAFLLIPRIEPRVRNLQRSGRVYTIVWIASLLPLVGVHAFLVLAALGWQLDVNSVVLVIVGITFAIIGNYLGKVRSNFFVGIRTPWTLSSDLSWNKTHRLGGRLFVLFGIILVLAAVWKVGATEALILMISGAVAISLISTVYSYLVWRSEQTREAINS